MANTFTLDDIRSAADKKYGATNFPFGDDTLVLRNALRLSKADREAMEEAQKGTKEDPLGAMGEALKIAAEDRKVAEKFLKEVIGEDAAMLATVFDLYVEGTQVGEA